MSSVRLFVYGSLKRGFRHHEELAGVDFLGEVTTASGYRLVRYGDYPALVRSLPAEDDAGAVGGEPVRPSRGASNVGPGVVQGELYGVPEARLPTLDAFEECPSLYQRELIELSDGSRAFAYVISPSRAAAHEVIAGGRWREGREAQRCDIGL